MSHGGGGNGDGRATWLRCENKLNDLTGEAYDKEFLKQMILHHEQARRYAKYEDSNAKRQEIKDLASVIIYGPKKQKYNR